MPIVTSSVGHPVDNRGPKRCGRHAPPDIDGTFCYGRVTVPDRPIRSLSRDQSAPKLGGVRTSAAHLGSEAAQFFVDLVLHYARDALKVGDWWGLREVSSGGSRTGLGLRGGSIERDEDAVSTGPWRCPSRSGSSLSFGSKPKLVGAPGQVHQCWRRAHPWFHPWCSHTYRWPQTSSHLWSGRGGRRYQ